MSAPKVEVCPFCEHPEHVGDKAEEHCTAAIQYPPISGNHECRCYPYPPDCTDREFKPAFIADAQVPGLKDLKDAVAQITARGPTSYHLRPILTEGVFGEPSKIREELEELEEALEQGNPILALCELADLYGALEAVAAKLGSNMYAVAKMAGATKRAFETGYRKAKNVPTGLE